MLYLIIGIILFALNFINSHTDHSYWQTTDYWAYYFIWLLAAVFGTYGVVTIFFK